MSRACEFDPKRDLFSAHCAASRDKMSRNQDHGRAQSSLSIQRYFSGRRLLTEWPQPKSFPGAGDRAVWLDGAGNRIGATPRGLRPSPSRSALSR